MRLKLLAAIGLLALLLALAACSSLGTTPAPTATLAPTPSTELSLPFGSRSILFDGENHSNYIDLGTTPVSLDVSGYVFNFQTGDEIITKVILGYLVDDKVVHEISYPQIAIDENGRFTLTLEFDENRRLVYHSVEIVVGRGSVELARSVKVTLLNTPAP
jgi:hypothetical protein